MNSDRVVLAIVVVLILALAGTFAWAIITGQQVPLMMAVVCMVPLLVAEHW